MPDIKKDGLTSDVYFKCLFGRKGNEDITKSFIQSITKEKILSVSTDFKLEIDKDSIEDKGMTVDLLAKDEKLHKYIVEMQKRTYQYLPARFVRVFS